MKFGFLKTKVNSKRHYVIVMAFAILLIGILFVVEPLITNFITKSASEADTVKEQVNATNYQRSAPTRLVIPSINLDTTFVTPLGLLPDQTVSVPNNYTQVGWYSGGVTPGEIGSSVILGHVDSKDGPAVFYSLGQVKIGDLIEVTKDDGTIAKFKVTKLERHPQSNFPTLAVYGPTDKATLRLVTCSGIFDRTAQLYSHNLIVFAELSD